MQRGRNRYNGPYFCSHPSGNPSPQDLGTGLWTRSGPSAVAQAPSLNVFLIFKGWGCEDAPNWGYRLDVRLLNGPVRAQQERLWRADLSSSRATSVPTDGSQTRQQWEDAP